MNVNIRIWCQVRSPIMRNNVAAVITPSPPITPSATSSLARMTRRPIIDEINSAATKPVMRTALASWSANPHQEKSSSGFEGIHCLLLFLFDLTLKKIVQDRAQHDNCSQL